MLDRLVRALLMVASLLCGADQAAASTLRCGDLTVAVAFEGDTVRLTAGGETFELRQAVAASGARYTAGTEPPTTSWSKGRRAALVLRGVAYPECEEGPATAFRARGNEPGWTLAVDGTGLELTTGYGERRLAAAGHAVETVDGGRVYRAEADGRAVVVTVADRVCTDTMTGMPHPHEVTVELDGERLEGCGGEPADLLRGAEWVVGSIAGRPALADPRATLTFGPEGQVFGSATCNRFTGGYKLTGENLTLVGPLASTMMACEPEQMAQERLFLDLLARVTGFSVDADGGGLVLRAADGRTVSARKA